MKVMVLAALVFVGSAPSVLGQQVSPAVREELAPGGRLRVGLNLSNAITVAEDRAGGELRGTGIDLGRALAADLGVSFEVVRYPTAGALVAAARRGDWDIAFMAVDAARAAEIGFSAPYMEVENTYLVPPGSPLHGAADVDRPGVRVAVQQANATDLFLTRTLQHAQLVRAATEAAALEALRAGQADAVATARAFLAEYVATWPGARVLDGTIIPIAHGIAVPRHREAALEYVRAFVEHAKQTGLVQQVLTRRGLAGLTVAPSSK